MKTPTTTRIPVKDGLKQALLHALQMDALRAAHHAYNPRFSKLNVKRGSMEETLVQMLKKRSVTSRKALLRKVNGTLVRDSSVQQFMHKYRPDMNAPETIFKQVIEPMGLKKMSGSASNDPKGSGRPGKSNEEYNFFDYLPTVQWHLMSVYCKDETNGAFGTEWGRDEIHMGGFGLDALGRVQPWKKRLPTSKWVDMESFKVGDFDDTVSSNSSKRRKVYNPSRRLIEFPIFRKFPYILTNTFQLVEDDDGGSINKYFEKLVVQAIEKVQDYAGEELFGENAGDVEDNIIWKLIWDAILDFFKWIARQFVDNDEFPPVVTSLTLKDEATLQAAGKAAYDLVVDFSNKKITLDELMDRTQAVWTPIQGAPVTETIKAHGGTYEVTYQWRVFLRQGLG